MGEMMTAKAPWGNLHEEPTREIQRKIADGPELPPIPEGATPLGRCFLERVLKRDAWERPFASALRVHEFVNMPAAGDWSRPTSASTLSDGSLSTDDLRSVDQDCDEASATASLQPPQTPPPVRLVGSPPKPSPPSPPCRSPPKPPSGRSRSGSTTPSSGSATPRCWSVTSRRPEGSWSVMSHESENTPPLLNGRCPDPMMKLERLMMQHLRTSPQKPW